MEREHVHGRNLDLPYLHRNIPRGNQWDAPRHFERGRGRCNRIPLPIKTAEQENHDIREQFLNPSMVVRCDDVETATLTKKLRKI